jgi:hypothetical protein
MKNSCATKDRRFHRSDPKSGEAGMRCVNHYCWSRAESCLAILEALAFIVSTTKHIR